MIEENNIGVSANCEIRNKILVLCSDFILYYVDFIYIIFI